MSAPRLVARRIARRLRALFAPASIDREMREEMNEHLALEADDLVRSQGLLPDEARRRAAIAFGGRARHEEAHRDARGIGWAEHLIRDIRHASRGLRRNPGFTLAAVCVLALGIGATTAVYSVVNAVLRNPRHNNLAVVYFRGFPSLSTVDFLAIAEQQHSFSAVGAMRRGEAAFRAEGEAELVGVARVSASFFQVLHETPIAGRTLSARDDSVGAEPVAVVSYALAMRALGGPANAVGRKVAIDGIAHTVVGVLPPPDEALLQGRSDVWTALQLEPPTRRGPFGMLVVGRLAPGVDFASATRDLTGISQRVFQLWESSTANRRAHFEAVPIRKAALSDPARMLRLFGIAVLMVLLIGVANVSSLMLVRAMGRMQEVSLRSVLGASRVQLVRLFVTESLILAVTGAVAGVIVALLAMRALALFGPSMPGLAMASLDLRAVALAGGLALVAGLIVGASPVTLLAGRGPTGLGTGARAVGNSRGAGRLRSGFVVAQFALALPLLAVSGLMLASVARLQRVDPGFDPANLVTARIALPSGKYASDTAMAAYWTRALALMRDLPGVREAGLVSSLPPDDFGSSNENFNLIDRPVEPGNAEPNAPWPSASAEYFSALGVRLLEGRMFAPSDTGPAPVILVSRAWAQHFYPGESPVGKTMVRGGCTECDPTTIIGVVSDVRYSGWTGSLEAMYSPVSEGWPNTLYLFVRTASTTPGMINAVRSALRSVDPGVPLGDIAPMEQRLYESVATPRQWASLLSTFAAVALSLTAVGVFGMLSYMVGARRREIGVRMALGARRWLVLRMVMASGMRHAIFGIVAGLALAIVAGRALAPTLYGVGPYDPTTLTAAIAVLLGVTILACWLPAQRAASVAPMEAIRVE